MDDAMESPADQAYEREALETLYAKTLYTLRESRKSMLRQYAVESEAALLEKIRCGELAEHPAYDHYLSALIIEQTRLEIRAQATELLGAAGAGLAGETSVHLMLQDKVAEHYAQRLSEPVRMAQDALLLSFDNGLMLEVRYFSTDEYSIGWSWGDAELRIDTAPVHPECGVAAQHLHDDAGGVRVDPVTVAGTECWLNFSRLLDALLIDPLLEHTTSD